jgi:hypothetical protein
MALRIPGKGVSAAHIPYCFIQNAKPCSLSANWGQSKSACLTIDACIILDNFGTKSLATL